MTSGVGSTRWALGEGYIPPSSHATSRDLESHEALCMLNAGSEAAHVELTVYFADRDPVGPYRFEVAAQRTLHLRLNSLRDPAPIPTGTEYAMLLESDHPIVVQHTRLDSRQAENALMTTIAFPCG